VIVWAVDFSEDLLDFLLGEAFWEEDDFDSGGGLAVHLGLSHCCLRRWEVRLLERSDGDVWKGGYMLGVSWKVRYW